MILKGFKFGLILQFALGPVFIFIFKVAGQAGFLVAEAGVLAATLVDALFVTLAILGIGKLLEINGVRQVLKYFGALVLFYFGLGTILDVFGIGIIPSIHSSGNGTDMLGAFITTFILTASSPLSILFWTGVFATKAASENFSKRDLRLFGIGTVLTTLVFLTIVAALVSVAKTVFLTQKVMDVMNIIVGIVIILFGIKMLFKKITQPSLEYAE